MTNVKDSKGQEFTFGNLTKEDYPELEGKIIKYDRGDVIKTGLVVGCNRSVGLTIVNSNDKDNYLVCLNGHSAPGGTNTEPDTDGCTYDELFDAVLSGIQDGVIIVSELGKVCRARVTGGPDAGMCSFGQ